MSVMTLEELEQLKRNRNAPPPAPPGTPGGPTAPTTMRSAEQTPEVAAPDVSEPNVPAPDVPAPENQPTGLMPAARQTPAPEPVTYDREGNPIQGVSGRLDTLLDSDSPYIQRARTRGRQTANRRGLMNSSIAARASEASAIDAAFPIAAADADIAARERTMRSQEWQQYRAIKSQELMQQKGLDHDTAERVLDRELSELLQKRDHLEVQAAHADNVREHHSMTAAQTALR